MHLFAVIAGVVYAPDATANSGCQSCKPGTSMTAWTNVANGAGCPIGSGVCSAGGCVKGVSCSGGFAGRTNCGAGFGESCCTSPTVTGGTFYRTYTNSGSGATNTGAPATLSSFRLDKYLVTVGRFRQFVKAWNAGYFPPSGSGIQTQLNGGLGLANNANAGTYESGWDATNWANDVSPTDASLNCFAPYSTWTSGATGDEHLPINCVNWWEAYAFCIWDGGFLPTDVQYGYAAAGAEARPDSSHTLGVRRRRRRRVSTRSTAAFSTVLGAALAQPTLRQSAGHL